MELEKETFLEVVRFQLEHELPLVCEHLTEYCKEILFQYGVSIQDFTYPLPMTLVVFPQKLQPYTRPAYSLKKEVLFLTTLDMARNGEYIEVHQTTRNSTFIKYTLLFLREDA